MVRGIKDNDEFEIRVEQLLEYYLSLGSFEEFLEYFDLTPLEIFLNACSSGLVNEEDFEKIPENL